MIKIYNIKEDKLEEFFEYVRQLIKSQYGYINPIGISYLSIDSRNVCGTDIYDFNFNANNSGSKCINVGIYKDPKVDNPPLIVDDKKIRGYDYYTYSTNVTIKLSNFLNNNPQWSDITDWADPIIVNREKCKYTNTDGQTKTCGFRRPDEKEYILDIPDEALDNGSVVGNSNPSAPINVWIRSMEESLTTRYYRDLALDDVYDIKRNQTTWVDGLWFGYDYNAGLVEVFTILDYKTNLISRKTLELGIINIDSLSNNVKVVKEIEKSLFERYDRVLKVDKVKIILSERGNKIKI